MNIYKTYEEKRLAKALDDALDTAFAEAGYDDNDILGFCAGCTGGGDLTALYKQLFQRRNELAKRSIN